MQPADARCRSFSLVPGRCMRSLGTVWNQDNAVNAGNAGNWRASTLVGRGSGTSIGPSRYLFDQTGDAAKAHGHSGASLHQIGSSRPLYMSSQHVEANSDNREKKKWPIIGDRWKRRCNVYASFDDATLITALDFGSRMPNPCRRHLHECAIKEPIACSGMQ